MGRPRSPHRVGPAEAAAEAGLLPAWHCPFDCGQTYKRSSGRSIRRHVDACFRSHHTPTAAPSDSELSALISAQQVSGQQHVSIRRWRMKRARQVAEELADTDRWDCMWACGKSYHSTSIRSIQRHVSHCPLRTDKQDGEIDSKRRESFERSDYIHHTADGGQRRLQWRRLQHIREDTVVTRQRIRPVLPGAGHR